MKIKSFLLLLKFVKWTVFTFIVDAVMLEMLKILIHCLDVDPVRVQQYLSQLASYCLNTEIVLKTVKYGKWASNP